MKDLPQWLSTIAIHQSHAHQETVQYSVYQKHLKWHNTICNSNWLNWFFTGVETCSFTHSRKAVCVSIINNIEKHFLNGIWETPEAFNELQKYKSLWEMLGRCYAIFSAFETKRHIAYKKATKEHWELEKWSPPGKSILIDYSVLNGQPWKHTYK